MICEGSGVEDSSELYPGHITVQIDSHAGQRVGRLSFGDRFAEQRTLVGGRTLRFYDVRYLLGLLGVVPRGRLAVLERLADLLVILLDIGQDVSIDFHQLPKFVRQHVQTVRILLDHAHFRTQLLKPLYLP